LKAGYSTKKSLSFEDTKTDDQLSKPDLKIATYGSSPMHEKPSVKSIEREQLKQIDETKNKTQIQIDQIKEKEKQRPFNNAGSEIVSPKGA